MKVDYSSLEKKIKLSFKNKELLIRSLTHKSFDKENNNEKVEFLGDRVLGLIMAKNF
jgi:ribonuclease-3